MVLVDPLKIIFDTLMKKVIGLVESAEMFEMGHDGGQVVLEDEQT